MTLARYLALGDSLSIDLYPAKDAAADPEPRGVHAGLVPGLGAAALLHTNDDARYPEFAGRDLRHRFPGIAFDDAHVFNRPGRHPSDHHATAGATTVSVLAFQLHRIAPSDEPMLVTLTVGRDDTMRMLGAPRPPATLVATTTERLVRVLDTIAEKFPQAETIVTTVFDPTDGVGRLDLADPESDVSRELQWLDAYNAEVRRLAAARPRVHLADAAVHFRGHGLSAPPDDRWIWDVLPFEPNARGASEIRRLWWAQVERLG